MPRRNSICAWLVCFCAVSAAPAAELRVPAQYPTIQAAIDAAAPGDVVLVAPGTYSQTEVRPVRVAGTTWSVTAVAFLKGGVTLLGEAGGDVVLDISGLPSGGRAACVAGSDLDQDTIVQGITLQGASQYLHRGAFMGAVSGVSTFEGCTFQGFDAGDQAGGGILYVGSGLELRRTTFVDVRADIGGGVFVSDSELVVEDCEFKGCQSENSGACIFVLDTSAASGRSISVLRSRFWRNNGRSGLGLALSTVSPAAPTYTMVEFRECEFTENIALGTAMLNLDAGFPATVVIDQCVFADNETGGTGAFSVGRARLEARQNSFVDNRSAGSAIRAVLCRAVIIHNNLLAFQDVGLSVVQAADFDSISSECNVFWGNSGSLTDGYSLSSSDRSVDPLLCGTGDYTVQSNSPCVEPGSLGCGQIGAASVGCGVISVEAETWSRLKSYYRD